MKWHIVTRQVIPVLISIFVLTTSVIRLDDPVDQARLFTAHIEYDYIAWTVDAVSEKLAQAQLNPVQHLSPEQQSQVVVRYFDLVRELEIIQGQIFLVYSNPQITDPQVEAVDLVAEQGELEETLNKLAPLAESVLQYQVAQVLSEQGMGFLAQQVPPVLFHSTPLPMALIVSPRGTIRQEVNISLLADLGMEDITRLEEEVAQYMDASVLVVDVGGIGVYPTMVQRASSLEWTLDTIAHEWTHNYLTLHPLGMRYDATPQLRTMNETTASIVGAEISAAVMERYYPDTTARNTKVNKSAQEAVDAAGFDFQHEMHLTRVGVDELLAQGRIDEAEVYMEERRIVFVENGYMIRKLNQAYFAFHGAYAEETVGAAGEDPVGPAVRALRAESSTLVQFLRRISWMDSFGDLQRAVE